MAYHFDPETLEIDHTAIAVDAAISARGCVERYRSTPYAMTYEAAFAEAQTRYLDCAKGIVESRKFVRKQEDLRAKMTPRERQIEALREAAHLAPMIDDTPTAIAERDRAERELAALMAGAV